MQNSEIIRIVDKYLIPSWKALLVELHSRCPLEDKYASLWVDGNGFDPNSAPRVRVFFGESVERIEALNGAELVQALDKLPKFVSREEERAREIKYLQQRIKDLESDTAPKAEAQ